MADFISTDELRTEMEMHFENVLERDQSYGDANNQHQKVMIARHRDAATGEGLRIVLVSEPRTSTNDPVMYSTDQVYKAVTDRAGIPLSDQFRREHRRGDLRIGGHRGEHGRGEHGRGEHGHGK
jgi:hypothetical protein